MILLKPRAGRFGIFTRRIASLAAFVVAAGVLTGLQAPAAQALDGGGFDPGNIISDSEFYSTDAMSQSEIQDFLNAKCGQSDCLNSVSASSFDRPATNMCPGGYSGSSSEPAAAIIYKVQRSCGISAKALLVILQKEQGLVTWHDPSSSALQIAMGYGCPDTAECDSTYYGLYNQIYNAASQLKRYGLRTSDNTGFRSKFQIGVPYPILYNPNSNCGTLTVTVRNMATTALYYYTPYTPNAAALANLGGSGDDCSSYGNRNFWAYYTQWFGSTQGGSALARSDTDPTIYVVTSDKKYPVRTTALFTSLAALGPYRTVSQSYLDRLQTDRDATNVLRDETTGSIYLAADGIKNPFPTCALVASYFSTCYSYIDLPSYQLTGFATGQTVTQFVTSKEAGVLYFVGDAKKRALYDTSSATALANGGSTVALPFRQAVLDLIPSGTDLLRAGLVIKSATASNLYLTNSPASAIPISSSGVAESFGISTSVISADTLAGLAVASAPLSVAVTCGVSSFVAGGGMLWPVASVGGLPTTALDASTCAVIPKSSQAVSGPLFLRVQSTGYIYAIADGRKQFMSSMSQVYALNGSAPLVWVPTNQTVLDSIPTRVETVPPAALIKSTDDPTIYLVDGTSAKIPVPSFALLAEFGLSTYSVRAKETLDRYATAPSSLTLAITCGSTAYVAGAGQLWAVANVGGLPTTALDAATCAALPKSAQPVTGALFLRVAASGYIYAISGGQKQFMNSMSQVYALNGSGPVVWIPTSQAILDTLPTKRETLDPTQLVKYPNASTVFMIDGTAKVPVPSFALMAEFGIFGYTTSTSQTLDEYPVASAPLSVAVTCGVSSFVAGGGMLWPVASVGGLPTTALDASTCAVIPKSSQAVSGPLFLRVQSTGYIYAIADGRKQFMSSMSQVYALNGSAPLVWVPTNQTVLDSIPNA